MLSSSPAHRAPANGPLGWLNSCRSRRVVVTSGRHRALITGVLGQDGWYLARRLADAGHEVHGTDRHAERVNTRHDDLPGVQLHHADLVDERAMGHLVQELEPTHIFNLAGSTSVARSWSHPAESAEVLGVGAVRLLAAAWDLHAHGHPVRFLQASSAEIFGDPPVSPQNEDTPIAPVTPYGAAKAFAHSMVGVYRRRGLFASTAILYNHESPRRPESFVAAKIARGVAEIAAGQREKLTLGNIDAARDWGFAPDYVDAMCRIIDAPAAGDHVVATGEARSVRDFVAAAFRMVGIEDWERRVEIDRSLFRPADPLSLVGDATKLRSLGWRPTVTFEGVVEALMTAQIQHLSV
ncbi:GDP-mannose 4,6-dehydratase [Nocardioides iriomotensis]|uniref:GDP-mannose 4,6-dehydratase n=1 Tax=Nocardioides iriomotensis TaxID=715784 RepID=A0A4Q5IUJ8_9ACTN|nr:GDP-mannose 4,6-dehydratase [Nocardioides iriomotensis]RYU09604.1 GDP-mannose 4,6-dehydratase [Nocardioides iriomotensis]